jgi:uncharacterized protein
MEVSRADYIALLDAKRGNNLVKIITGVRRCGKSYLLFNLFRRHLLEQNIPEDHIISLALDDFSNRKYLKAEELYDYVTGHIHDNGHYYILLDEIQMVEGFESVLNGFMHIPGTDIYVTGSNSKFLSSDIITEFRGRSDEIRVYPFNFAEFYSVVGGDKMEAWSLYSRYGGMPQTLQMQTSQEKENYLKNLFDQVYISDIINRYHLRGQNEIGELTNVVASSIGALTNPLRLSNTFMSERKLKISQFTVSSYLDYLEDSFLINKACRYDVKGRKYIGTPFKYYFVDMGLRNARLNFRQQEENHIMENVIYNELLRRHFSVDVGMVQISTKGEHDKQVRKQLEVDFIANQGSRRYYIQSAFELGTQEKMKQEEQSFLNINDSFKKILIQKSSVTPWHDERGVLIIGLMDFLLHPECLEW